MNKRIWAPVMVAAMVVSSIPSANFARNTDCSVVKAEELLTTTIDGMRIENGILTRYEGNATDIVIPEGVISIGDEAFRGKDIVNVTIPESVTEIGEYSFSECRKLKKVEIKGAVDKINAYGFIYCEQLEEIDVSQVKHFGRCCFSRCDKLKNIDLSSVQTMESTAFYNTAIENVILNFISEDNCIIPESAFKNCSNLKKVEIKGKLSRIEEEAFQGCECLENIIIDNTDNISYVGRNAFDGTLWLETQLNEADNHMLVLNHILVRYNPEVSYAGEYGGISYFDGISYDEVNKMSEEFTYTEPIDAKMETVTIPGDITQIAGGAFYGAYSVEEIIFDSNIKCLEIGERAFDFTTWELEYMKNHNFMVVGGNLLKIKCNAAEIEVPNGINHIVKDVLMRSPSSGKLPEESIVEIQRLTLPQTVKTLYRGDFGIIKKEIIIPSALEKEFEYYRGATVTVKDIDTSLDADDLLPGYEGASGTSPTPIMQPTNVPIPTIQVTDTPMPTETSQPTDTPIPTLTPQATNIPTPTLTPQATNMPTPTLTPQATNIPTPTLTPQVTNIPTPTEISQETKKPITTSTIEPGKTSVPTVKPTSAPKVKVKKAVITKTKRLSKTKLKVYIKKTEQVKGYQVIISTDKKFKKNLKKVKTSKQSVIMKSLKKGQTYYVKVRAYKLNGKKKVYGKYSNIKQIRM